MAYDEELAARIREAVGRYAEYREIKMFGGLCWTVNTHMAVGLGDSDMLVHVGTEGIDDALVQGAHRAVMGERTMGGVVMVAKADLPSAESLDVWVRPAVERAQSKPPKKPKKAKK